MSFRCRHNSITAVAGDDCRVLKETRAARRLDSDEPSEQAGWGYCCPTGPAFCYTPISTGELEVYLSRVLWRSYDPTVTTKCFVTGSMIFQVPLKSASTTNASPGPTSTDSPPSGVMTMRPEIMWTNS